MTLTLCFWYWYIAIPHSVSSMDKSFSILLGFKSEFAASPSESLVAEKMSISRGGRSFFFFLTILRDFGKKIGWISTKSKSRQLIDLFCLNHVESTKINRLLFVIDVFSTFQFSRENKHEKVLRRCATNFGASPNHNRLLRKLFQFLVKSAASPQKAHFTLGSK